VGHSSLAYPVVGGSLALVGRRWIVEVPAAGLLACGWVRGMQKA
jgi:hypothetical protein